MPLLSVRRRAWATTRCTYGIVLPLALTGLAARARAGCGGLAGKRRATADTWSRLLFHLRAGAGAVVTIDALLAGASVRAVTPDSAGMWDGAVGSMGGAVPTGVDYEGGAGMDEPDEEM